jgi:hypothetical protein
MSWGFLCDQESDDIRIEDAFKLYLDPNFRDPFPGHPTTEEAKRYFKDYMGFVYAHVDKFFRRSHPRWDSEKVEFLFSIPTTWKNPNQSAEIERLIKEAGFGGNASHQRVKIAQTEAEAAAVYAAKGRYKASLPRCQKSNVLTLKQSGDVILVCDAGGGTTVRELLPEITCR